ncbi:MAG: hypothetical protein JO352_34915 [Chloroflexi bacterium]|nr:hypothetical protein [Chloroflexota bacterium]
MRWARALYELNLTSVACVSQRSSLEVERGGDWRLSLFALLGLPLSSRLTGCLPTWTVVASSSSCMWEWRVKDLLVEFGISGV